MKKTTQELVSEINAATLPSPHYAEDNVDLDGSVEVARIDLDEHRWYVCGTIVFKHGEDFFGINGPISLKSESMSYSDCGYECTAFEMKAVPSVTYVNKY